MQTAFDRLTDNLCQKINPLSAKAKSLFFVLSAYRSSQIVEYICEGGSAERSVSLRRILDHAFEHAAKGLKGDQTVFEKWRDELLNLCPQDEDGGVLDTNVGFVTTVIDSAVGLLYAADWYFRKPGEVDCCLGHLRYTIGLEMLEISYPGDDCADHFYKVVMSDPRFQREKGFLEDDIQSLLQERDVDFPRLALELKERALSNRWDGEAFCKRLLELEEKWRKERETQSA